VEDERLVAGGGAQRKRRVAPSPFCSKRAHCRGTWARVTIDQFRHLTLGTVSRMRVNPPQAEEAAEGGAAAVAGHGVELLLRPLGPAVLTAHMVALCYNILKYRVVCVAYV
jgi:hypothetical protein